MRMEWKLDNSDRINIILKCRMENSTFWYHVLKIDNTGLGHLYNSCTHSGLKVNPNKNNCLLLSDDNN